MRTTIKFILIIFSILFANSVLVSSFTVFAHPGNTDSNGGHTCWTNCEKWGLEYGEYHYHNGEYGNSSPSDHSYTPTEETHQIDNNIIHELEAEISDQQLVISEKESLILEYSNEIDLLEEKIAKYEDEDEGLDQKNKELENKEEELTEKEDVMLERQEELEQELDKIKKERESFEETEVALNETISDKEDALKQKNKKIFELEVFSQVIITVVIIALLVYFFVRRLKNKR